MPAIRRGVPLSGVDHVVFLAGIPVDPVSIAFELRKPDGFVAVDEDGVSVTARAPLSFETGRFHAGNTVLAADAPVGTWKAKWSVKKTPTAPLLVYETAFDVSDSMVEDPVREAVSRRDIPDTANLKKLRARLMDARPDDTKWAFFNSELQGFLDDAFAKHTAGKRTETAAGADDVAMATTLAHCAALTALATDRSRFFKWQDGNEAVDKTMQPRNLVEVCRVLQEEYRAILDKRFREDELGLDQEPARDLLRFRRIR